MIGPDPGRVLRWALLGWGLGHLAMGRAPVGAALLASEAIALALVAWLTIGLAETSAYLVPYLAGTGFLVAWAWQAVAAYRAARQLGGDHMAPPLRSPALAINWLALPLLVWGSGYWLVGGSAATPAAVLDRFVTAWTAGTLSSEAWPASVVDTAEVAADGLSADPSGFRDVRVRVVSMDGGQATAVAEAIHYERRETRVLGVFAGSELVPVADRTVLRIRLAAEPVALPGGGDLGAVRWEVAEADGG